MDTVGLILLILHNLLRWVVLIAGVLAVIKAIAGWMGNRNWGSADRQLGLIFTISLDLQVLIGLLLYFVFSDITTSSFSNFGEAMGNSGTRFFLVEHSLLMIVALIFAHIGRSQSKKASPDVNKHKRAAIFFTVAIILILVAIPWTGRPLLRLG